MSADTDALRDIFLEVAEEDDLTEPQQPGVSHDPVEADDAAVEAAAARAAEDAVADAIDEAFSRSDIGN